MKSRIRLVFLTLTVVIFMSGCQSKTRSSEKLIAEEEMSSVSEKTAPDSDQPKTRFTTQRFRNPDTGKIETRRVPVESDSAGANPAESQPAAEVEPTARYTTQRVRNPETGEIVTKRVPVQPKYIVRWEENCPVEEAFEVSAWVLEDLGLAQNLSRYRTRQIRNPRTGRVETRRVSEGGGARSDGLSAELEGNATAGIRFQIGILLIPPESSAITITATSKTQPESVLEQQSLYLKEKISGAIGIEPTEPAAVPYPETMILDCTVGQVADAIYTWAERQGFERGSSGGNDRYYRLITCETGSGIRFGFTMRLIETDRTKLDINASYYEGKEEFGMILQGLMETLEGIKAEPPQTEKEQTPYPETLMLKHSVGDASGVLEAWIKNMGFNTEQTIGDRFYRYVGCKTGSGVRLKFWMKLIDTDKTKLQIRIYDYERKEDFPMILKSLQEVLAGL